MNSAKGDKRELRSRKDWKIRQKLRKRLEGQQSKLSLLPVIRNYHRPSLCACHRPRTPAAKIKKSQIRVVLMFESMKMQLYMKSI